MKYLRNINESSEHEFTQDIKDILLEVEDIGYETSVGTFDGGLYAAIYRPGRKEHINFNEIKDCLLRIKDYVGDRYVRCELYKYETNPSYTSGHRLSWHKFNLTEDSICDEEVLGMSVDYKRIK